MKQIHAQLPRALRSIPPQGRIDWADHQSGACGLDSRRRFQPFQVPKKPSNSGALSRFIAPPPSSSRAKASQISFPVLQIRRLGTFCVKRQASSSVADRRPCIPSLAVSTSKAGDVGGSSRPLLWTSGPWFEPASHTHHRHICTDPLPKRDLGGACIRGRR